MKEIQSIKLNKEFLFIYDAALCNPNGDPDQENKPRMDRATQTNLVSDTRLKRTIRDFLIDEGKEVFVSTMGGNKVSVETRLLSVVDDLVTDEPKFLTFVNNHIDLQSEFASLKAEMEKPKDKNTKANPYAGNYFALYHEAKADVKKKDTIPFKNVSNEILIGLIKDRFIDIRYFGGAFAVAGFSRTITGPIQVNWGYSLHPVELNTSNSIVTIMGSTEGQSGIGKKETLFYSLIAFTGTINVRKAEIIGLAENDVTDFRRSIVRGIVEQRSDSKKNQYPRLYLEIEYKKDKSYGQLGDLRSLIDVSSNSEKDNKDFSKVRSLKEVRIDFKRLYDGIAKIKENIECIRIWQSIDDSFASFNIPTSVIDANKIVKLNF